MSSKNKYLKLDILRVLLCITVLLYHLNILKGGYLAVCSFLTISGYLLTISLLKNQNISLKEHYKKRIKKLYIPLLLVVLLTLTIIPLFKNIYWLNLKPETTSVLLNYNNFWQISTNQDYFARADASPFVHMWYISLLFQLELIFPIIIKLINKIKNKKIPILLLKVISIISVLYFLMTSINKTMAITYYHTLSRAFSYILGVTLGFIHTYKKNNIIKNKTIQLLIYIFYIILLTIMFITIKSTSQYFNIIMLITSIITIRIINYSLDNTKENMTLKRITNISYEIYLLQYPIIYIFDYIELNQSIKIVLIIIFTLLLSKLLYLTIKTNKKKIKILIILPIIIFGLITYINTKDHTKEMNELQKQLEQNEIILKEMENNYNQNIKNEEEKLNKALEKIDVLPEELKKLITNMPLVGIGDSVMVGGASEIKKIFPNSYIDAQISRSMWTAEKIINNLKQNNKLGNPVVIHLGTNGECTKTCKDEIMKTLETKKVFWINTTNYIFINNNLKQLEKEYNNLEIIDWYDISKDHKEYFYADGIHLTQIGRQAYANSIYEAIYNNYQNEYQIKKETILKEYEENKSNKITFYGNEMLLNALKNISEEYKNANIYVESNLTIDELKQKIKNSKENNTITKTIILIFDKSFNIETKDYIELINQYKETKIYLITTKQIENSLHIDDKYLMPDRIHLNDEGNKKIIDLLKENIK